MPSQKLGINAICREPQEDGRCFCVHLRSLFGKLVFSGRAGSSGAGPFILYIRTFKNRSGAFYNFATTAKVHRSFFPLLKVPFELIDNSPCLGLEEVLHTPINVAFITLRGMIKELPHKAPLMLPKR